MIEVWIVDQQAKDPNYSNGDIETVLIICNFAQVLMTVVLFVYLICVLCKLDKFLKSFKEQQLTDDEKKVLKNSKNIFLAFIVNLGVMMVSDSLYSLL